MSDRCYEALISVGSNIAPEHWIPFASQWLTQRVQVVACAPWFRSVAVGGGRGTPDFVNGALRIRTDLPPRALHALLRHLESLAGRVRTPQRFAPRTLDLDLMHMEPQATDVLENVPPADLREEAYALVPCAQVWPTAVPSGWSETLAVACARRFPEGSHDLRPCRDLLT